MKFPNITSTIATSTEIRISWSIPTPRPGVVKYDVSWQRDTSRECSEEDQGSATTSSTVTSYVIDGLEEDSTYIIVVTVHYTDSNGNSIPAFVNTTSAGMFFLLVENVSIIHYFNIVYVEPSVAPSNVVVTRKTATEITVQWEKVPCIHRNGDISGYNVLYRQLGGQEVRRHVEAVPGRETYTYTISQLLPAMSHEISVAGVNEAGTGVYSSPISTRTESGAISLRFFSSTLKSITVTWKINHGVTPTSYSIAYTNTNIGCYTDSNYTDITDTNVKEFTITNLEEFTEYNITASVNYSGVTDSDRVRALTLATGEWTMVVLR